VIFKGMATGETENIFELGQFVVLAIRKENWLKAHAYRIWKKKAGCSIHEHRLFNSPCWGESFGGGGGN
jgi:hypothetical protein